MLSISRRKAISLISVGSLSTMFPIGCFNKQSSSDLVTQVPLHYRTIAEISKMIKSKEISSVELTQLILNRISRVDTKLNSYITVMKESALANALELDKELESGKYRGPLHGIPVAVKDLLYTTNAPTTGGHAFKMDFVPDYNSTVVSRLKESGAVLLGKLNMTEGAMAGYQEKFKIPVNPWGPYEPGESSSGSAVATAAGLCFGSIGTDTGGSIRLPALVNGIVGLKPTYGLVSRHGVLPLAETMDHVGPMARSVEGAAILLQAIAGQDSNDLTSLSDKVPDYLASLKRGVKGIRIGIDVDYINEGVEKSLATSIQNAIQILESSGGKIVRVKMPGDKKEMDEMWYIISAKEAAIAHRETYPSKKDEYGRYFRDYLDFGLSISEDQYVNALNYRRKISTKFRGLFKQVDAIVCPSGGMPKVMSEEVKRGPMSGWDPYLQDFDWHFLDLPSLAGTPAMTLPCGDSKDGAPPGLQIMANIQEEPLLFRIGYTIEQATNWPLQHPDL